MLRWFAAVIAVAALAMLTLTFFRHPGHNAGATHPDHARDYSTLAAITQPEYRPAEIHLTGDAAARFGKAMTIYQRGDCENAIPPLRSAASRSPLQPAPRFYLAACELIAGELGSALADLQIVVSLGPTPFRDESQWLIAKTWLRLNDEGSARAQLRAIIQSQGPFREPAAKLLQQLDAEP